MKKRKKGFTLIELLAVIVVLAIIALIAVPLIISVIEKAEMEAFRDTGYGIVESGRLYKVNEMSNEVEKEFTFPDNYTELNFSGEVPTGGTVLLNSDSTIDLNIYNSKYCAVKSSEDEIVDVGKIVKDDEGNVIDCDIVLAEDKCSNPEITVNPSVDGTALSKSVTISYKTSASCNVKLYKVTYDGEEDSNEWLLYDEDIKLDENAKVEAKLVSGKNKSEDSDVESVDVTGIVDVPVLNIKPGITVGSDDESKIICTGSCDNIVIIDSNGNKMTTTKTDDTVKLPDKEEIIVKENIIECSDGKCSDVELPLLETKIEDKTKESCSVAGVSEIEAVWKQSKSATITSNNDCDTLEYQIEYNGDKSDWTTYSEAIEFTQNVGYKPNLKLNVRHSDSTGTKSSTTLSIYIYQIDNISPYTPILSSYKSKATKLDDYGMECSTTKTDSTTFEKCAIWVNCKEGAEDENGDKLCKIYSNVTALDNENGSGIKNRWYKYSFLDEDGNELDGSTDDWTLTWSSGGSSKKAKTVRRYKYEDQATNESSEMELTIYWNATSKGTLADACESDVWDGSIDTSWYNETETEFTINNASELAGLSKLVNDGIDDFSGKTINLGCSINLNDISNYDDWNKESFDISSLNEWTPIGQYGLKESVTIDNEEDFNKIKNDYNTVYYNYNQNSYSPTSSYNSSYSTYYYPQSIVSGSNYVKYTEKITNQKEFEIAVSNICYNGLASSCDGSMYYYMSEYSRYGYTSSYVEGYDEYYYYTSVNTTPTTINSSSEFTTALSKYITKASILYYVDSTSSKSRSINYYNPNINDYYYFYNRAFNGTFNGNSYAIKGLYMNDSYENYLGLFGYSDEINVSSLGVKYTYINGKNNLGTIIAYTNNVNEMNDIDVSYATVYGNSNIGGLIGFTGNISMNNINVSNIKMVNAGGLIGYLEQTENSTDINLKNINITNMKLNGSGTIGGLIRYFYPKNKFTFENIKIDMDINSTNTIGGIIGYTSKSYSESLPDGVFKNIEMNGSIYVSGGTTGGLFGQFYCGNCSNEVSFSNITNNMTITTTNNSFNAGLIGWLDYRESSSTFTFDTIQNNGDILLQTTTSYPYSYGGIIGYASIYNGTLNMSNIINNGSIYNVTSSVNKHASVGGIIGFLGVKNFAASNLINTGNIITDGEYIGGIIGQIYNYSDSSFTISKSYNTGNIISNSYLYYGAGIVAYSSSTGTIDRCFNTGNITGSGYISGILGYTSSSNITNNYNTGDMTALSQSPVAGIVSYASCRDNNSCIIKNNYNTGKIINNASSGAGGIVGDSFYTTVDNNYNLGSVTSLGSKDYQNNITLNYTAGITSYASSTIFKNNYNIGSISGDNYTGGIVSSPTSLDSNSSSTFENNYYLIGTSLSAIGYSSADGDNNYPDTAGKYEALDTMPSVISVVNGDDAFIDDVAGINNGYPILKDIEYSNYDVKETSTSCFEFENGVITGYDESCGENVVIPSEIDEIKVIEIGANAFKNSKIKSVILPSTLEKIGANAFYGSSLMMNLTIPENVTIIDNSAFYGTKITGLNLKNANSLQSIKGGAFSNVSTLSGTIKIPSNLLTIEGGAFIGAGITSLDLSEADSLVSIGASAFDGCSNLTGTLVIPKNLVSLSAGALNGTRISQIDFSKAEKYSVIESGTFSGTSITGTLSIPACVTKINGGGLSGLKITNLDLSNATGLTLIDSGMLSGVNNLTGTIVVPKNVTIISSGAFYGTKITGIDLSKAESLVEIGSGAFNNISTLTGNIVIPSNVTTIGDYPFSGTSITSLDLSNADGLKSITSSMFSNISTLTGTVTIPKNVTSIMGSIFSGTNVTGIDLSKAESLTEIRYGCFSGVSSLTGTITIPKNVVTIADGAFQGTNIKKLDLSQASSLVEIKGSAFSSTGLESVDFEGANKLTTITEGAFSGVTTLTGTIFIPSSVKSIVSAAFYNTSITKLDLSQASSLTEIGGSSFANTKLENLNFDGATSLINVYQNAFGDITTLTGTLVYPEYGDISGSAFAGTGYTSIDFSKAKDRLTEISEYAFYGMSNLTGTIVIPNNVTTIGKYAFYNTGITDVEFSIPEKITKIDSYAFSKTKLTSMDLRELSNLSIIGSNAYLESTLTGTIYLPSGLTSIGENAFKDTTIDTIYIDKDSEIDGAPWGSDATVNYKN